jgi:hypothetical protein
MVNKQKVPHSLENRTFLKGLVARCHFFIYLYINRADIKCLYLLVEYRTTLVILIASARWRASSGVPSEIWTRACHISCRCATIWATPHPSEPRPTLNEPRHTLLSPPHPKWATPLSLKMKPILKVPMTVIWCLDNIPPARKGNLWRHASK